MSPPPMKQRHSFRLYTYTMIHSEAQTLNWRNKKKDIVLTLQQKPPNWSCVFGLYKYNLKFWLYPSVYLNKFELFGKWVESEGVRVKNMNTAFMYNDQCKPSENHYLTPLFFWKCGDQSGCSSNYWNPVLESQTGTHHELPWIFVPR